MIGMQPSPPSAGGEPSWDPSPGRATSQSKMLQEYEARHYHICQAKYPPFGFGPPLTRSKQEIWACLTDREAVKGMLTSARCAPKGESGTLL